MCKMAFEIQGHLHKDENKDQLGILQTRGFKTGDYVLKGCHDCLSSDNYGWREEVLNCHIDFNVINEDGDLYLRGIETYTRFYGVDTQKNCVEWNFPVYDYNNKEDKEWYKLHPYFIMEYSSYPYYWWLPRQDQLQELVAYNDSKYIPEGMLILDWFYIKAKQYQDKKYIDSWEKLWLCIVMEIMFNKHWNGSIWE